jgi:hypothetical protein
MTELREKVSPTSAFWPVINCVIQASTFW